MAERGIAVDHSTVHRWAIKLLPALEKAFRRCKRAIGKSWRMDETYVKVPGEWRYLYRAVHKEGNMVDFLLRARRNKAAALRYFEKSIQQNGVPETVTIDKGGANLAALHAVNAERDIPIKIRQVKYLNNVVERDHRAIKRIIRPMLGFKDFRCACHSQWHRDHAYDQERADDTHWQNQGIRSLPVLLVGYVSDPHHIAFARPNRLTATEPASKTGRLRMA